jgi:hypothetical protein
MSIDYLICPFYEYEKNGVLHCENKTIVFPGRSDRMEWLKTHCGSWNYKICKLYAEQIKKYNDAD